jgi:hypothetical protein
MSILAPHKFQDEFVYIRVPRGVTRWFDEKRTTVVTPLAYWRGMVAYIDKLPGTRTISSRRVERAVENDGYLAKCAEESLEATMWPGRGGSTRWVVVRQGGSNLGKMTWPTLREAYDRYANSAMKEGRR